MCILVPYRGSMLRRYQYAHYLKVNCYLCQRNQQVLTCNDIALNLNLHCIFGFFTILGLLDKNVVFEQF